jgi:hypothetical protein
MELRGGFFSESEILDLFQIVSLGKKSGEILLYNANESITFFVKDGKVINLSSNIPHIANLKKRVKNGEISFPEAIKFILHYITFWNNGNFSFTEKEIDGVDSLAEVDIVNVMMDFIKEKDELRSTNYREVILKNSAYILSKDAQFPLNFDEESWSILVSLINGKNPREVIFEESKSFQSGIKTILDFLRKGIIKEGAPTKRKPQKEEKAFVTQEAMEKIRNLLIEIIGPMGEFLIDETLDELQVKELPAAMINTFIETLINKVPESCLVEGESCREKLKEDIGKIISGG